MNFLKKLILILPIASVLTGCATTYQPSGFSGGYTDMALNQDTYLITFRGNGFTSSETTQGYALRRAAEIALNKGYKFFIVLNSGTNVSQQTYRTPATVQTSTSTNFQGNGFGNTSFYGNNAFSHSNYSGYGNSTSYTTVNPGSEYEIQRYKSGVIIKLLHSNKSYPSAFDAKIILSNYRK